MTPAHHIRSCLLAAALAWAGAAAAEPVVVVVSPRNPLAELERNHVAAIFLGRESQFPNGEKAVPIDQQEGAPARDEFYASVADKSPTQVKAHWAKIIFTGRGLPPREVANSAAVKEEIARNPNAIGYIEKSQVDAKVKVLLTP